MDKWFVNNQFLVLIGGIRYSFSKVSNLAAELEYDTIAEGGRNWGPHLVRKPSGKCETITFERGTRIIPSILAPPLGVGTRVGMVIIMLNNGFFCHSYGFDEGLVTKFTMGDLDGMGHEIWIERMEISHSGLYKIKVEDLKKLVTNR